MRRERKERWVANPPRATNGIWLLVFSLLLLIVLVLGGYALVKFQRVRRHAYSAVEHLRQIEAMTKEDPIALVREKGLSPIREELLGLNGNLRAVQREIGGDLRLLSHLGWLPSVGPTLRAAPYLLQMGVELSTAGEAACEGAEPALEIALGSGSAAPNASSELSERLLEGLVAQRSSWVRAQQAAERAVAARARFPAEGLHPLAADLVAKLDAYLPWLRVGVTGAVIAPELLGASVPRRYLILAQNNDELRATGGFISGIGLATLHKGRIAELSFQDSYAVDDLSKDHPDPPPAMREQMGIDLWLTKDTNWFPDFPTSARACEDLFRLDQGIDVDGVIAADLVALQRLIGAIGPLTLEKYGQIDGSNVLQQMQSLWAPSLEEGQSWKEWESIPWEQRKTEWFDHRKDFMPEVVSAAMQRILSDPSSLDIKGLLLTVKQLLDEKHVLIYLHDPQAAQILRDLNWDGVMPSPAHDYVMVVDTNVGYTKVNPNIQEQVEYRVEINSDGSVSARLTISYKNTSTREIKECVKDMSYDPTYELMTQRCYWDYVRVYLPPGVTLLQSESLEKVEVLQESNDHTVLATSFVLPPRGECKLSFQYQLPGRVLQRGDIWTYHLFIQKQPGTEEIPWRIDVRFPDKVKLTDVQPEPVRTANNLVRFRTDLRTDQQIRLSWQP